MLKQQQRRGRIKLLEERIKLLDKARVTSELTVDQAKTYLADLYRDLDR